MPGWHDASRELRESGKIAMAGIVLEQHPERARLFMQWKQMGWPVLVDSLNLLGARVVPLTVLVDEYGIVRRVVPSRADARSEMEAFVAQSFEPPEATLPIPAGQSDRPPSMRGGFSARTAAT